MVTQGWSPKAIAAGVSAFVLTIGLPVLAAVIEALISEPRMFDGLPEWLRVGILAGLVALGTLVAAWRAGPGTVITRSDPGPQE